MKFEKSKMLSAADILKLLQELTQQNLWRMQQNNNCADILLHDKGIYEERTRKLKEYYVNNNQLFKENKEYLELHSKLLSFLKSLDQEITTQLDEILADKTEILNNLDQLEDEPDTSFKKTVEGQLNFDKHHPFYNNDSFRQKLITYYSQNEEYEECVKLVKRIN